MQPPQHSARLVPRGARRVWRMRPLLLLPLRVHVGIGAAPAVPAGSPFRSARARRCLLLLALQATAAPRGAAHEQAHVRALAHAQPEASAGDKPCWCCRHLELLQLRAWTSTSAQPLAAAAAAARRCLY